MANVDQLKRSGRRAVRAWGRLTADHRVLPNVVIAGAQRCGTTSLHRWLSSHPGALTPIRHKGVHFFDVNYPRGLDWYRGHFPTRATVERTASKLGYPPIVYETTPYYMFHPAAPQRIAESLPDAKIIVVLRDPVVRAYSAWSHEFARGFEELDFAAAIAVEDQRLAGEEERLVADPRYVSAAHRHNAYVRRGLYVDQLRTLEEVFTRNRLLVIDYAALTQGSPTVESELLRFVGLPDHPMSALPKANSRERSAMDPGLRAALRQRFAAADADLRDWLGWEPTWMRT